MCHFVSFVIHRTDFEIFAGELNSHAGITVAKNGIGLGSSKADNTQNERNSSLCPRIRKLKLWFP